MVMKFCYMSSCESKINCAKLFYCGVPKETPTFPPSLLTERINAMFIWQLYRINSPPSFCSTYTVQEKKEEKLVRGWGTFFWYFIHVSFMCMWWLRLDCECNSCKNYCEHEMFAGSLYSRHLSRQHILSNYEMHQHSCKSIAVQCYCGDIVVFSPK